MLKALMIVAPSILLASAYADETANPNQRCVPNFENGQPAGYKCMGDEPSGSYEKLGLKNGDVIQSIDGQAVNDPAKAFELMNRKPSTVQISRNAQDETISSESQQNPNN